MTSKAEKCMSASGPQRSPLASRHVLKWHRGCHCKCSLNTYGLFLNYMRVAADYRLLIARDAEVAFLHIRLHLCNLSKLTLFSQENHETGLETVISKVATFKYVSCLPPTYIFFPLQCSHLCFGYFCEGQEQRFMFLSS